MQSLQELDINGIKVQIQGTIEEPLFDANFVLVSILKYKELNACRFYKDNKKDQLFVKRVSVNLQINQNTQKGKKMSDKSPTIQNQQYHKNANVIYLTELGLYECLFRSEQPFAQTFRFQIIQLLKNIRLDNIKLLIEKECEFTNQLKQTKNEFINISTKYENLYKQFKTVKEELNKCKFDLSIYQKDDKIGNISYIGITINKEQRAKAHKRSSSNQTLRLAYQNDHQIEDKTLCNIKCLNQEDRKYAEHFFIKRALSEGKRLMNVQIPKFDISKVSVTCKTQIKNIEESKDQFENISNESHLDTINEQSIVETDKTIRYRQIWQSRFDKYKEFVQQLQKQPKDSSTVDRNEYLLARWISKQKQQYQYMANWKQDLLDSIEGFDPEIKNIDCVPFKHKVQRMKQIFEEKGQLNPQTLGDRLYATYKLYGQKYYTNTINEVDKKYLIDSKIPIYNYIQDTPEQIWTNRFNQCKELYDQSTTRLLQSYKDQNGFMLGKWLARQKTEYKDKLTPLQIEQLKSIDAWQYKNKSNKQYKQELIQFYQQKQRLPKCNKDDQNEKDLYQFMHRNKIDIDTLITNNQMA